MRRFLILIISLGIMIANGRPARAQSAIEITGVLVDYVFGEQVTFQANIQPSSEVKEAYLFFQIEGDQNTHTVPLNLAEDGRVEYRHEITAGLIRPFARVFFWYRVILTSGESVESSHFFFKYDDDRYPWQIVENDKLRVHWYAGDVAFGQAALDAATVGIQSLDSLLAPSSGEQVDVFIYASATDVQETLGLGGYTWVGGHANPDLGVVLVSVTPGEAQSIEMERQIPHELAHVMLYQLLGSRYAGLPNWLVEGIASIAEQYPNSDYTQVLTIASQNNTLLDIANLCGPFPTDASGAILGYAESVSFTRYLHNTYGTTGLQALLNAYADGLSCEQGTLLALKLPLGQLDQNWRQSALGEDSTRLATKNLWPYLAILAIIMFFPAWWLGLGLMRKEKR